MKIYTVWLYNYEDSYILKVFKTEEKARKYMEDNGYDEGETEQVYPNLE